MGEEALRMMNASQWADIGREAMFGAPAQEEKEMEPVKLTCTHCGILTLNAPTCCKCAARTADLRDRWDRAFFAALGAGKGVTMAQAHADTTIRRHAELMARRDAAIAEVVG